MSSSYSQHVGSTWPVTAQALRRCTSKRRFIFHGALTAAIIIVIGVAAVPLRTWWWFAIVAVVAAVLGLAVMAGSQAEKTNSDGPTSRFTGHLPRPPRRGRDLVDRFFAALVTIATNPRVQAREFDLGTPIAQGGFVFREEFDQQLRQVLDLAASGAPDASQAIQSLELIAGRIQAGESPNDNDIDTPRLDG